MELIFSPFAGWMGDRRQFRQSEAARPLASAEATEMGAGDESVGIRPPGAETTGGLPEIADPRQLQASEQKPQFAGSDTTSTGAVPRVVETQLGRVTDAPASDRVVAMPKRGVRERLRRPLMIAVPLILAVFGGVYYLAEEPYVSTNDAFVRAAKITVNARVAGQAVEIAVRDNQRVQQGQVLFRIDPEPYQIAVDQAEARLASARLQIGGLKATYHQQQAELESAKDTAAYDEREY
jgi:hypothetical protein